MAAGAGTGILAYSIREGLGSPDPAAAEITERGCGRGMTTGVHKLDVPTLLVRGGSSDVMTREAAEALLRLLPRARFADVADASHMVAGDRNDVFSVAWLEFALPLLQANGG